MKGRISEIFQSVQGEGLYVGEKQVFVRFFGCNLGCKFCDTKLDNFKDYEPQELFERLREFPNDYHSISFTGGEPLLQKDFLKEVLKLTCNQGLKTYLETNGTLPNELKDTIDYLDIIAMDLKLPSSTDLSDFWELHHIFLNIASSKEVFVKTVICQSTEEEDLRKALKLIKETNEYMILVLQPNSADDYECLKEKLKNFKEICAQENIISCIIPQVHKIIGVK